MAMAYYGLIDTTKMTDARTALLCARLHLRAGKRRLEKGFSAKAIVTLYDAVLFGMRYYIAKHKRCASLVKNIQLWDAASLFQVLAREGVFDDIHEFNRFSLLVERALWQESALFDIKSTLAEVEEMLRKLGVLPGESLSV
jgi:hypothetical protein